MKSGVTGIVLLGLLGANPAMALVGNASSEEGEQQEPAADTSADPNDTSAGADNDEGSTSGGKTGDAETSGGEAGEDGGEEEDEEEEEEGEEDEDEPLTGGDTSGGTGTGGGDEASDEDAEAGDGIRTNKLFGLTIAMELRSGPGWLACDGGVMMTTDVSLGFWAHDRIIVDLTYSTRTFGGRHFGIGADIGATGYPYRGLSFRLGTGHRSLGEPSPFASDALQGWGGMAGVGYDFRVRTGLLVGLAAVYDIRYFIAAKKIMQGPLFGVRIRL